MIDGFALDLLATTTCRFPVFEAGAAFEMSRVVAFHVLADDLAMDQIGGFFRRVAQETLRRGTCGGRMRSRCLGSVRRAGWGGGVHACAPVLARILAR